MPADLPYMPSVANVPKILQRIREAATPPRFTNEFLKTHLGFGSSNDRSVIKMLKAMGFLSPDGTPTSVYNEYRGAHPGAALALGVKKAYAPLFLSDENVHSKAGAELLGMVKNTSGAGDAVAKKIATTFKALAESADWSSLEDYRDTPASPATPVDAAHDSEQQPVEDALAETSAAGSILRLHHDIHLHLPPTSDVSVYRAIFQAMKSELL